MAFLRRSRHGRRTVILSQGCACGQRRTRIAAAPFAGGGQEKTPAAPVRVCPPAAPTPPTCSAGCPCRWYCLRRSPWLWEIPPHPAPSPPPPACSRGSDSRSGPAWPYGCTDTAPRSRWSADHAAGNTPGGRTTAAPYRPAPLRCSLDGSIADHSPGTAPPCSGNKAGRSAAAPTPCAAPRRWWPIRCSAPPF